MEQHLSTLNLPPSKLNKWRSQGKTYISDLDEEELKLIKDKVSQTSISALNLLEYELTISSVLSFNIELDKVLIDEILPGRITELAGLPGTGKSQICFQLCISAQVPKSLGGVEGQVIYLNTQKNFSLRRIREIGHKFVTKLGAQTNEANKQLTEDEFLENIFVFNVQDMTEMFATAKLLDQFLIGKNVRLLIIDSISRPLLYIQDPLQRVTSMYKLMDEFQYLSSLFKFAVVITNNFSTKIKNQQIYYAPAFGASFYERINSRICLSKCDNYYTAELVKSVIKSPMTVKFWIS